MNPAGIDPATLITLRQLSGTKIADNYYLAGGTACALHLGHRLSYDLDFFSMNPLDPREILNTLMPLGSVHVDQNEPGTFNGRLNETKVSFFIYPYPNIDSESEFESVKVASEKDLVCMKMESISSRGVKRDFIDLYWLLKDSNLSTAFSWFTQKYSRHNVSPEHVLKSLVYFNDADPDPMPRMLVELNWELVKAYFLQEVKTLAKTWINP
jgi:predicted nucleotidyltransferase component of viral defense system